MGRTGTTVDLCEGVAVLLTWRPGVEDRLVTHSTRTLPLSEAGCFGRIGTEYGHARTYPSRFNYPVSYVGKDLLHLAARYRFV